jgi:hypothetical protein
MNKFLTVSKCLIASICVWLMGIELAAAGGHRSESRIKGVWSVRADITNCVDNKPGNVVFASFDAMNILAADGTFLDSNAQSPATQSAHFGYWRHVRGAKYEFAVKFFLFDSSGANTGWRIVRHDVVLSRSGVSFASGGTAETFDLEGNLIATGCSTSTGIRFD